MIAGKGGDAEVDVAVIDLISLMRPSCGRRFSAMSMPLMILMRGEDGGLHAFGNVVALDAHAVDAVADAHAVFHRFDVNVRGAGVAGVGDDGGDEFDDGGVIVGGGLAAVSPLQIDGAHARLVDGGGVAHDFVDRRVFVGEQAVDVGLDLGFHPQAGFEFGVEAELQGVDGVDVGGVADDDSQDAVFLVDGEDEVLFNQVGGDQVEVGGGEHGFVEVDVFHVVLHGQGLGDFLLRGQFQIQDQLMERAMGLCGLIAGAQGVAGFHRAHFHEDVGEFFAFSCAID